MPDATPLPLRRPPERQQDAPRATLVAPRVPRATLVRLPDQWMVGQRRLVEMPDGLEAIATLKGALSNTGQLPASGNQLGDTYRVGDHFWVWLTAPGAARPSWIDP